MDKRVVEKVEDVKVGDYIEGKEVFDIFYRTNTLRVISKIKEQKTRGLVIVVFSDTSMRAFPVGKEIEVYREDE